MLKDAITLRNAVFGSEQNYKSGAARDQQDDTAWFVNVYDEEGNVCATSRMIYLDDKRWRLLGKIAVLQKFRKLGLGKAMLAMHENIAKTENAEKLFVNAQSHALGFYKSLGYNEDGKHYVEEDIEMIPMSKLL